MDLQLSGLKALVTGGSGGIGFATAKALAEEGCNLALCARGEERLDRAVSDLRSHGVEVSGSVVDVSDAAALRAWVDASAEALGGIDILVANVSALGSGEGEEAWLRAFEIDLMHTVRTVEAALPHLKESDAAAVAIVSSVSGREAMAGTAYGTFKAALNHYGKGLAVQLARDGIRVNVVSPGTIYVEDGYWGKIERDDPKRFEMTVRANPMGRMGRPEEVGHAIAFLVSPVSSFTSGTNLLVDGAITRAVQM